MRAEGRESRNAITTLLYRYGECVDAADFAGLSDLFVQGRLLSSAAAEDKKGMKGPEIERFYAATNRVHEDGTLRTRHLCSNVIVEVDEDGDTATAQSCYVVFQATGKLPLQPIVAGRYNDRFENTNRTWHFAERVIHVDQLGELSEHLRFDLAKGNIRYDEVVPDRN